MNLLNQLTDQPRQRHEIILDDGSRFQMTLEFKDQQIGWFLTDLIYADQSFELTNLRVCTSPNLLHQFRNKIPFGIAIYTEGNQEPTQLLDFSSGRSKMYVLTHAEVILYSEILSGQVS